MTVIKTTFKKLISWMTENVPDVQFNPPASAGAIQNLAEKSGLTLPEGLAAYLSLADGEKRKSAGAIGNWRLMPVLEIQGQWGLMAKLAQKGAFDARPQQTEQSPYIKNDVWNPLWIPIAASDTGHYFCLDTDPPRPERFGQVLLYLADDPRRYLVAGSLADWFDRITRDLEAGLYTYDPIEGFNGEAFMWSALEGKHYFDDIPGHLIT